jgi:predicted phage terminase large subunit-like protein
MEDEETGEKLYLSKVYDAVLDEDNKIPLWPARWPWAKLMRKKRTVTTRVFNKEYRNKYTDEDSPFPEEKAKYIDRIEVVHKKLITVTAVDPSAKAAEQNDFRAVVTFGLEPAEMVFICLHAWIKKRSIGEMFGAAYDQHDQYGSRSVAIEENMLKDFLHEAIQNYAKKVGRYLPWKPIDHSTNKIGRIVGTCEYLWEYGKLLFQKQQSDQDILKEQFVYLLNSNVHDDGPDAAEMAINELQKGLTLTTVDVLPEFAEGVV